MPLHAGLSAPGHTLDGVESSLLGAAMCALPFLVGWRIGWVAGGDVKLIAAIGALGGISMGLESVFLALFAAGSFIFLRLCWDGVLLRTLTNGLLVTVSHTVARKNKVEPRAEYTSTLRFGPFALAGAAMSLVLHGGLV